MKKDRHPFDVIDSGGKVRNYFVYETADIVEVKRIYDLLKRKDYQRATELAKDYLERLHRRVSSQLSEQLLTADEKKTLEITKRYIEETIQEG